MSNWCVVCFKYWHPNKIHHMPVDTLTVFIKTNTTPISTSKQITFYILFICPAGLLNFNEVLTSAVFYVHAYAK